MVFVPTNQVVQSGTCNDSNKRRTEESGWLRSALPARAAPVPDFLGAKDPLTAQSFPAPPTDRCALVEGIKHGMKEVVRHSNEPAIEEEKAEPVPTPGGP